MMRDVLARRVLRGLAVLIAIVAVIDPAITTSRTTKPEIAVVAVDSARDAVLADRVARSLAKRFTVIRAPIAGASGMVVIGNHPPIASDAFASPAFAVLSSRDGPTVTLDAVRIPATSPADSRVPVVPLAHVTGARGRTLDVALRAGDLVVDHVSRNIATNDERLTVPLAFVPTAAGAAPLRVVATISGRGQPATADVAVDVRDRRWAVLFFDPRPSWMSTFVRRSIERDTRFVVTSRVVTSRNVSTDAGRPPGRLDDLAALSLFDAVVIGAPEALSDQDVAGLESFMRRRAGSVVLLFDRRVTGPYERLTEVAAWGARSDNRVASVAPAGDSGSLRATELAWPTPLPAGAELMARAANHPIVWRSAIGAGRLVVSGALDAWRFRDDAAGSGSFDRFWRNLIADAANATPAPVTIEVAQSVVGPGASIEVGAVVRDAALRTTGAARSSVSAVLEPVSDTRGARSMVRLWPGEGVGEFHGSVIAPSAPGVYRLAVTADGSKEERPVVVTAGAEHASREALELLAMWARARGGRAFAPERMNELGPALEGAIRPAPRMETWHPMRSAWWIIPFALALGAEWWLRRRRGLA